MPRSFSIDCSQYTLYRHIGLGKEPLKTRVDRSDVIACLNSLGYANIPEQGIVRARYGTIPCLEDTLTAATLGIPSTAMVEVRVIGRRTTNLLLTFIF